MAWWRWFAVGLVGGLAVVAGWRALSGGADTPVRDFSAMVGSASVARPSPDVFRTEDVTIQGLSRRAIVVDQQSRIAWDLVLPAQARLEAYLALREEVWNLPGDGVLFRIGLSLDDRYEELLTRVVRPQTDAADRGWIPIRLDLAPYAGRQVSLIFNTGAGLDGNDVANDRAVWGAPTLFGRAR